MTIVTWPRLIIAVFLIALIGGAVLLASWDIPVPSQQVDVRFDDARFPR